MNVNQLSPSSLNNKTHFEILDGLRGLAALAVVIFHFMEWIFADFSQNFIAHGFLAVDFFFCLSGFVIGYAYDERTGKMSVIEFIKLRLIRLHPMVVLGSVLGLLTFLFEPFSNHADLYSAGKTILVFITSTLMIPYPVMEDRAFNLFGLNAPSWSLFWEYVASVFYALILWRIKRSFLLILTLIAAVLLFYVSYRAGNLLGGWSGPTFWDGGARIFFSFLAGLTVYRFNLIIKNKLGFFGICILLSLAFIMPFGEWNWLTEPLVVLVYFPLLISLGAGARLTKNFEKVCVSSGRISYPLYMTHYAVLWMFGSYYTTQKPGTVELTIVVSSAIILMIGFAYLVMVTYDMPIRKYLSAKLKKR